MAAIMLIRDAIYPVYNSVDKIQYNKINLTDNKLKNAVDQLIDVGMRFTTITSEIPSSPDCSSITTMGYKTTSSSTITPLIVKIFALAHLDL